MFPRYLNLRYVKSVDSEADLPQYGNEAGDLISIDNTYTRRVIWSGDSWQPYPEYYREWCANAFNTACKEVEGLTDEQRIKAIIYAFSCIDPNSILRGLEQVRCKNECVHS